MANTIDRLREMRWRCRTDLLFLTQILLGEEYHLDEATHRPVVNHLQKFPVPTPEQALAHDHFENNQWHYRPLRKLVDLDGGRRMLLLDSRGFAKSTFLTASLILFSGLLKVILISRLLFIQANLMRSVHTVIKGIKAPFQYNETFRALFPEHCPQNKVDDWGTMDRFTTEAPHRYEPAPELNGGLGLSLDAGTAGLHFPCNGNSLTL